MAPSDELSLSGALWQKVCVDESLAQRIAAQRRLSPALARCLVARGVHTDEALGHFLAPSFATLHDPFLIHGMTLAVERLRRAVSRQEHIRVVTDYDVDGTTSSLILQSVLGILGHHRLSYHVPHRMEEGYGFSKQAAQEAARDGVQLLVTADIGIRDHEAVSEARRLGLDVLIVDHHLPPGCDVPSDALAVLCPPQQRCSYPNPQLAACGVSFKLAQALLSQHPKAQPLLESLLKLAAMGTVADVVDLSELENRAIVALGLRSLNTLPHRPGLAALLEVARLRPGEITASDLGFRVGPRINAAGRLSSAKLVVELLLSQDPVQARVLAQQLDQMNDARKTIQQRMMETALEELGSQRPAFVLISRPESEHWHRGVAGIVAARLRDLLNRPVAVIAETAKGATGSIRSTPQVHAVHALQHAAALLERFGGHPAAAGFSLPAEQVPQLRELLEASALQQLDGACYALTRDFELELDEAELTPGFIDELSKLEPHGKGNPEPRIALRVRQPKPMELFKDEHLRGRLSRDQSRPLELLWWGGCSHVRAVNSGRPLCLLGTIERSVWNGRPRNRFVIEDARLS